MALHLDPSGREPIREARKTRLADLGEERRVVRDGVQLLAHGALVCPACKFPLVIAERVAAGDPLRCGFCSHEDRAREFLARDVYDSVANEVYLVARLT